MRASAPDLLDGEEFIPPLRIGGIPPGIISATDYDITDEVLAMFPLLVEIVRDMRRIESMAGAAGYGETPAHPIAEVARAALARLDSHD